VNWYDSWRYPGCSPVFTHLAIVYRTIKLQLGAATGAKHNAFFFGVSSWRLGRLLRAGAEAVQEPLRSGPPASEKGGLEEGALAKRMLRMGFSPSVPAASPLRPANSASRRGCKLVLSIR